MSKRALLTGCIVVVALAAGCRGCGNSSTSDGGTDGGDAGIGKGDGGDGGDGYQHSTTPPGSFSLDGGSGATANGVGTDPSGSLVLKSGQTQFHYAYIANHTAGTVSKFDTQTNKEVARYWSVLPISNLPDGGVVQDNGLRGNAFNSPSRTAIDLYGNVWVANRAPAAGIRGSVTKIAGDPSGCRNGGAHTSQDLNGNGIIEPNEMFPNPNASPNWADPNAYDDCILFSTLLPTPSGGVSSGVKGRALAISAGFEGSAGDVWAGVYDAELFVKLDPVTGVIKPVSPGGPTAVSMPSNFGPYGAVVDGNQRLWSLQAAGDVPDGRPHLIMIDTINGTLGTPTSIASPTALPKTAGGYGIAVDNKNRVWLAGWDSPTAVRYTPPATGAPTSGNPGTWTQFDFSGYTNSVTGRGFGNGRGIAADDQGYVWMSAYSDPPGTTPLAQLIGFNGDDGGVKPFAPAGGGSLSFVDMTDGGSNPSNTSIGVGLDQDNNIWVNNYSGNAMKVDRTTGSTYVTPHQTGNLYTYSDFTGYALRNFTSPKGTYTQDINGCAANTTWNSVTWDAVIPANTTLQVFVKAGADVTALNNPATTKYGPFTTSPANLQAAGVPKSQLLRVEFDLTSLDRQGTPTVKSFDVSFLCFGGLN